VRILYTQSQRFGASGRKSYTAPIGVHVRANLQLSEKILPALLQQVVSLKFVVKGAAANAQYQRGFFLVSCCGG
jgi:hypothetical protein